MKRYVAPLLLLASITAAAGPVLQMNRAFNALSDLVPYLTDPKAFMEKKNEKLVSEKITELQAAFKAAKHDTLLKEDLFAPSYALINENISESLGAFKNGKKDYAHWRLKEVTSLCLDCHTRLPTTYSSSFQNGDLQIDHSKFKSPYNLGIAQLIVRRYIDAKDSFTREIQDRLVKKEFIGLELPFKQLLLIETKVLKNPENLSLSLKQYALKKQLPDPIKRLLVAWTGRLDHWKGNQLLKTGFKNDKEVERFIGAELKPLKVSAGSSDGSDVDLLFASGLLSNYLFENPKSEFAPQLSYWLGWTEKNLKRDQFFGSGDLFLKQCIKRYPTHPIARECLNEYKESVGFDFSGSSGTHIPKDVKKELDDLEKLLIKPLTPL